MNEQSLGCGRADRILLSDGRINMEQEDAGCPQTCASADNSSDQADVRTVFSIKDGANVKAGWQLEDPGTAAGGVQQAERG